MNGLTSLGTVRYTLIKDDQIIANQRLKCLLNECDLFWKWGA